MSNDQTFKIKNGLSASRVLQSKGTISSNDIDLSTGTHFSITLSADTTVTFSNPPSSGVAFAFTVTQAQQNLDGNYTIYKITWPSSVKWDSGIIPKGFHSETTYVFLTVDGGTTYYAKAVGKRAPL